MKIKILQVGKTKDAYVEDGMQEFLKRLRPFADVEIVTFKSEEAVKVPDGNEAFVVVLDEKGKQLESVEFAEFIGKRKDVGQSMIFVIGGAYGLPEEIKKRADFILSFSKMTFTHQMIRLFLLEQIYRGFSILSGKNYHHA